MKAEFSCETCGGALAGGSTIAERLSDIEMRAAKSACRCSDPTYGPLTVEMVAEALEAIEACTAGPPEAMYYYQPWARFVIRLLERVHPNDDYHVPFPSGTRDWLLKLAREK